MHSKKRILSIIVICILILSVLYLADKYPDFTVKGKSNKEQEEFLQVKSVQGLQNGKLAEADFMEGISQYYGYYKISQFWPYDYYDALKYDRLPLEEADMMLGRIVEIRENMLVTCDSFRSLGSRGGREAFTRNYSIEMIAIE